MKDLTEADRMRIAYILNCNVEKRSQFEEGVKWAKKILGKRKVKVIRSNAK